MTCSGIRTFGVCDIENLMGTAPWRATASRIRSTMDAFCHSAGLGAGDLVVIAVNPALAVEVHRAAPAARLRCRRGRDGADRALLEELEDPFWVASRFDRVVVGSGDGIFTRAVAALNHTNVSTTVVARPGHLARTLRLVAQHVVPLGLGPLSGLPRTLAA
jgi:hypothetical protein